MFAVKIKIKLKKKNQVMLSHMVKVCDYCRSFNCTSASDLSHRFLPPLFPFSPH